jgi:3-phenylpropionate/cinnamic acid dioxygenase small subunit
MAHTLGSGDRLARGAVKATFMVRDAKNISDKKWAEMFDDFDPETFEMPKVKGEKKEENKSR